MRIGVLRHQLFRRSEPFILDQAGALPTSEAVFLGRVLDGEPPPTAEYRLFAQGVARGVRYLALGGSSELARACTDLGVDLLHSHFGVEGMCAFLAAHRLRIPSVTTLHGYDVTNTRRTLLSSKSPSWWRYAALRGDFFRKADKLVCVSNFVMKQACRLGASEDACVVIPTGVDTTQIRATRVPDSPLVVHVGRLVEVKGCEYLIRAIGGVAQRIPDVQLRIVGDGPLGGALRQLVLELGLERNITFVGSLPHRQTLEEISRARLLCLPSAKASSGAIEGLGQVLLEAGAMGRPAVGTRHGGIPEVIQDGENGYLVPEKDVGELSRAIELILSDAGEAQRMGDSGRRLVESRFDLHRSAARLEAVYASMV